MEEIRDAVMEETKSESQIGGKFYETIEAPKFIDLTAPDHRPIGDDRYWFCARVGCGQNHEEEMDSEAIYKDFVLRVMAARSPSVHLRSRKDSRCRKSHPKCPSTVPPKASRSRISKLAIVSLIPQKAMDRTRPKTGQIRSAAHKHSSTPKAKGSVEAFTTPGKQNKRVPNPGSFRSVQNPRNPMVRVSRNRILAKALVFHSPKRMVKLKRSADFASSMKKMCDGVKKLEIEKKGKDLDLNHKPVPSDKSGKPLKGREVKSRVFDSLHSQKRNSGKTKCPATLKERVKEKEEFLDKNRNSELREMEKRDDTNSKNGENDKGLKQESRLEEAKDPSATKESDLENGKQHESSKTINKEKGMEAKVGERADIEEGIESDDNENASASDNNRKTDHVVGPSIERKAFGIKGTCKTAPKINAQMERRVLQVFVLKGSSI
ncbi:PREDICTED: uncharacterized protein LOC104819516 [Tarenaya hassleriana]|uniref:uncharacterized protein LOC104819516 n=1 Tax=Tarenaya hassleriana TaxID=28532 RepID=UPI00053C9758|nr:PREDICTED: uncharacterized protein LOC104819516 [Tarenaya hassleriana]